jgi:hypothetical protein
MTDFTLAIASVAHIQSYIFNSNRLRENIGASYLVDAATGEWAWEAAEQASGQPVGVRDEANTIWPNPNQRIEAGAAAEVLYAAGGNFVALFSTPDMARNFVRLISRRVLENAPGLHLMIDSHPYRWGEPLGAAISDALRGLRKARSEQPGNVPLAGLGVTVMCRSTALPAVDCAALQGDENEEKLPVSAEILAKINAAGLADARLRRELSLHGSDYTYPRDFDQLGRTRGESSFIAVVHADGNGMGKEVKRIADQNANPRAYIEAIHSFSEGVARAAREALQATLNRLTASISSHLTIEHPLPEHSIILQTNRQHELILPFRPLVFGGDDVTFVCDGRLGISLALEYMAQFQQQTGGRYSACAGVAIVKSHYPFARAYQLAEELTRSAKAFRKNQDYTGGAIDWHLALTGLFGSLDQMREQQLTLPRIGYLPLRPVTIGKNDNPRDWNVVKAGITEFQKGTWADKRNKQKDLRDALREGPHAVERFVTQYRSPLPGLGPTGIAFEDTGWAVLPDDLTRCGYYDALELADLHITL